LNPDFRELFAFCDLHASRQGGYPEGRGTQPRPMFYDTHGFAIPGEDGDVTKACLVWARMKEAGEGLHLIEEFPDGSYLSTVWLGNDHGCGWGAPLIFETMYFSGEVETIVLPTGGEPRFHPSREFPDPLGEQGEMRTQLRYMTEEAAAATHREIVRRLRKRWEV